MTKAQMQALFLLHGWEPYTDAQGNPTLLNECVELSVYERDSNCPRIFYAKWTDREEAIYGYRPHPTWRKFTRADLCLFYKHIQEQLHDT